MPYNEMIYTKTVKLTVGQAAEVLTCDGYLVGKITNLEEDAITVYVEELNREFIVDIYGIQ